MITPSSFEFNPQTIQNCLQYLSDSLDWLNRIDAHEMFRISQEMDVSLHEFLAERIESLVITILGTIFESLMPSHRRITFNDTHNGDDVVYNSASLLVCQHWRNIALATPALWTDILVSSRALSGDGNNPRGHLISTQLMRSGIRPLKVQFNGLFSPASLQLPFIQDLLKQVHRIRRLLIRLQSANDDIHTFMDPSPLSDIRTPRLQTLAVCDYGRWQIGIFRTLRHLLLRFQHATSLVNVASGLMAVFASNAHTLEDIVVSDPFQQWDEEERITAALEGVPPVDMPALKRLVVKGMPLFRKVMEPKLVLHECARDYHFYPLAPEHHHLRYIGDSNRFPAILNFVTGRKECGQAIETLRFVRDSRQIDDTEHLQVFNLWRSHLESYVANVVFDDVPEGGKPPRMELPAVCQTKSPVHAYWKPWNLD
ncbi:hypothetical protein BDW22DRAFT_926974 [Trametopsis cervina]|nr:hypothetical protein BDW22DRAFT_926974 [Trametopsis cervina]